MSNFIKSGRIISVQRTILVNINVVDAAGVTLKLLLEQVTRDHNEKQVVSQNVHLKVTNTATQYVDKKYFPTADQANTYVQETYLS